MEKDYTSERLEKACRIAIQKGTINCKSIKIILKNKMENAEILHEEEVVSSTPHAETTSPLSSNENVRGEKYYH